MSNERITTKEVNFTGKDLKEWLDLEDNEELQADEMNRARYGDDDVVLTLYIKVKE